MADGTDPAESILNCGHARKQSSRLGQRLTSFSKLRLATTHSRRSPHNRPTGYQQVLFPLVTAIGRIFRNEGGTGSNPVSSIKHPGQSDFSRSVCSLDSGS